jgi:hypothetical protein
MPATSKISRISYLVDLTAEGPRGELMIFEVHQTGGITEYLDFVSIQQQSADIVFVEEVQDYESPKATAKGLTYQSMRLYALFDLRAMRRKVTRKVACSEAMGGGEVVLSDEKETDWAPIDLDSPHHDKIKALRQAEKLGFW